MNDPQRLIKLWFHEKTAPHGVKTKLAAFTGKYTTTQISRMRNLDSGNPKNTQTIPLDMIQFAAQFFNELPPGFEKMADLMAAQEASPLSDVKSVDVLSSVPAGSLSGEDAVWPFDIERTLTISGLGDGDWSALLVTGDSMDRIAPDGSVIVFNKADTEPVDGRFYVFRHPETGEATFKMYGNGRPPRLRPYSNSTHDTIYAPDGLTVFGRVRKVIIDI